MDSSISILNELFDKVYVITISRNVARQETFRKCFEGLDFEFIYGVDGWKLSQEEIESVYDDRATQQNMGRSLHVGEIGATLSHKMIFEQIIANQYDKVLILEDDISFDPGAMKNFRKVFDKVPKEWELIYFGYGSNYVLPFWKRLLYYGPHLKRKWQNAGILDHYHNLNIYSRKISPHVSIAGWHMGSYAYAVSNAAARKMKAKFEPIHVIIDDGLSHLCVEKKLKAYITYPKFFFPLMDFKSSIWNGD